MKANRYRYIKTLKRNSSCPSEKGVLWLIFTLGDFQKKVPYNISCYLENHNMNTNIFHVLTYFDLTKHNNKTNHYWPTFESQQWKYLLYTLKPHFHAKMKKLNPFVTNSILKVIVSIISSSVTMEFTIQFIIYARC